MAEISYVKYYKFRGHNNSYSNTIKNSIKLPYIQSIDESLKKSYNTLAVDNADSSLIHVSLEKVNNVYNVINKYNGAIYGSLENFLTDLNDILLNNIINFTFMLYINVKNYDDETETNIFNLCKNKIKKKGYNIHVYKKIDEKEEDNKIEYDGIIDNIYLNFNMSEEEFLYKLTVEDYNKIRDMSQLKDNYEIDELFTSYVFEKIKTKQNIKFYNLILDSSLQTIILVEDFLISITVSTFIMLFLLKLYDLDYRKRMRIYVHSSRNTFLSENIFNNFIFYSFFITMYLILTLSLYDHFLKLNKFHPLNLISISKSMHAMCVTNKLDSAITIF